MRLLKVVKTLLPLVMIAASTENARWKSKQEQARDLCERRIREEEAIRRISDVTVAALGLP